MATQSRQQKNSFNVPSREKTKQLYERHRAQYEIAQTRISRKIRNLITRNNLNAALRMRVKSFDSYFNKILRFYNAGRRDNIKIQDMIGIRVVCSFLGELDVIKRLLIEHFNVIEVESKGAKHSFREFGYDSIHLLIQLPEDTITNPIPHCAGVCEVQLRTKLQDAWAEVEHELIYKSDYSLLNEHLKRKLAALNASLTLSDIIFQEIRDYQKDRRQRDEKRRESIKDKIDAIESISRIDSLDLLDERQKEVLERDDDVYNGTLDRMIYDALEAHSKQEYDKALKIYSQIIRLKPEANVDSIIHNHRGMVYFVLSNYDKAIEDFNQAIQKNQSYARAYTNRGMAFRMLQKYNRALEDFSRAIELDRMQVDAYMGRAQIYFELGNFPKALEECNNTLNIDPEYNAAMRFKQLINTKIF